MSKGLSEKKKEKSCQIPFPSSVLLAKAMYLLSQCYPTPNHESQLKKIQNRPGQWEGGDGEKERLISIDFNSAALGL